MSNCQTKVVTTRKQEINTLRFECRGAYERGANAGGTGVESPTSHTLGIWSGTWLSHVTEPQSSPSPLVWKSSKLSNTNLYRRTGFFVFVCFFSLEMLGDAQNARTVDFQWGQGIVLFLPSLPASRQSAASDEQRCQTWSQSEAWRCKRGKLLPWPVGPGRSTRVPPECRMAAQRLKESAPGVVCVWNSPLSSCSRRLFPRCLPPAFWAAWHLVWRAIDCQWSFLAHGLYYSDASDCAHRTGG